MDAVTDLTSLRTVKEEDSNFVYPNGVEDEDNKANLHFLPPNFTSPRGLPPNDGVALTKLLLSEARYDGFASAPASGDIWRENANLHEHPSPEILRNPALHLRGNVSDKIHGGMPLTRAEAAVTVAAPARMAMVQRPNLGQAGPSASSLQLGKSPLTRAEAAVAARMAMVQRTNLGQAGPSTSPLQLGKSPLLALALRFCPDHSLREEWDKRYHTTVGASNQAVYGNSNESKDLDVPDFRTPPATRQNGQRADSTTPSSTPGSATTSTPRYAQTDTTAVCRNFWRAGDYLAQHTVPSLLTGGMDHVRVHPKFLHSNATSHKWALGAIAELLDNAVDEVQNGATYVSIHKTANAKDNSPALVIQDDGGGMTPETMRHCMSLGYSAKNTATIGRYGNGFKTSTMRLGADVIVFSSSADRESMTVTLSIGLLSYTFLRETGMEDVVVPMINYRLTLEGWSRGEAPQRIIRSTPEDWVQNLKTVMQWSPYATEEKLLEVFSNIGEHGTKIVIYNLWMNDDGQLELDFLTDEQDIQLRRTEEAAERKSADEMFENHISNRYHHSLRIYASILYLRMPLNFQIILCGRPVQHRAIANDLKFSQKVIYKPRIGSNGNGGRVKEVPVDVELGFTKEAPFVNVHGFNVYHRNRLVKPFWKVVHENSSRGRGVVGVLEASYIEPAHDKQDFEQTILLQRLEARLKKETLKYWSSNCHLIGYQESRSKKQHQEGPTEFPSSTVPAPVQSLCLLGKDTNSMDLTTPGCTELTLVNYECSQPQPIHSSLDIVQSDKRRRIAGDSEHSNPGPAIEARTGMDNNVTVRQVDEDTQKRISDLVEENMRLKAKCSLYECERETMKSQISELEKKLKGP